MAYPRPLPGVGALSSNVLALRLIRAWKKAAGPVLWQQTRFMGLHPHPSEPSQQVLHLEVPDPLWRQELQHQSKEILERYHVALRAERVWEGLFPRELILRGNAAATRSGPFAAKPARKPGRG